MTYRALRNILSFFLYAIVSIVGGISFFVLADAALTSAYSAPLKAPKLYSGTYAADVVRVVDADTIKVRVHLWPNDVKELSIRVYGVDTPEKRRPKCELEREKAITASKLVEKLLPPDTRVYLTDVINGKFAGRAVAVVRYATVTGDDSLGDMLIRRSMAVPYFGKKKTKDWCANP